MFVEFYVCGVQCLGFVLYCSKKCPFLVLQSSGLGRESRPRGYKTFFVLTSAAHEIYPAHKCLKCVGILTFISMINTTSERLEAKIFFICRYLRLMSS